MAKLKIKRDDLIDALTTQLDMVESGWYINTKTGQIVLYSQELNEPEDFDPNDPNYLQIDPISSRDGYRIMEDFVDSLGKGEAATRLAASLARNKPFRHFKDTLLEYPKLRESWFKFEAAAHAKLAEEWCKDNQIEPEWIS